MSADKVVAMEKKIKKIRIIINPAAGTGGSILPVFNLSMKEAGTKWEASITHQAGDAIKFAKAAVKEGVDALAVYGGDGTLMEAISGLMGSDIPLAILPGGSANVMAEELGIPKDLKAACALMTQVPLTVKTIDVGQFGDRYFILGIALGFGAEMIKGADRETKNRIGIFAYFLSAATALKKTKKAVYHLKIDGQKHEVQGLTCIIANVGNLGFSNISYDKHINVSDGLLDVVVVRKANLSLFKLLAVTLLKRERPDNLELVEHWQGKEISVSSSPRQTVQCDGEVLKEMPLHIKIIPQAIKVLVPKKKDNVIE
ncbi:diacylglycerol kinase family lipid kinase [Candidatus Cryosericum terrychapinii]|jgi:YegS/Rv2252/BmrU family lipid kinase|uniref:Diacylglycerol kinase family lipid kinase n=2 Tax=Candidatus Cryosericum terrychapinii TaxID=2290919 RepID=A0A398CU75_9BACT|nr:diacylglycerol kinase family lipid kinase [Candidatus Cryosericum terrychapinii]